MTDFRRNNLDKELSPYLRQHADNPIWWQAWSGEVLDYAARHGKPIFVSVGYSTCHWCHVMAREAFSDSLCAARLDEDFVAVKVDREERPDIDQFLMKFLVATTGRGGWPLNVFLSPDLRPFFAMTYAAVEPRFGMKAFPEILSQVRDYYLEHEDELEPFVADSRGSIEGPSGGDGEERSFRNIDASLSARADPKNGGFRGSPKFPPHTALLYSLHRLAAPGEAPVYAPLSRFVRTTLDAMAGRGLHDFVAGGFYRYCVDEGWTVPHFEKMLYDQALCLWNYSVASRLYTASPYARLAEGIVRCLDRDFLEDGLFCAATDADTDHREGATYLWSREELAEALDDEGLALLSAEFELSEEGNFEGKNHLVTRNGYSDSPRLREVLERLRRIRDGRRQPFKDRKKLTSWNCLAGIGLLQASRHLGSARAKELAEGQVEALLATVFRNGEVAHGSMDGKLLEGRFLADHAAALLLLTYHHEERRVFAAEIGSLRRTLREFRVGDGWLEAHEGDFLPVRAEEWDSPFPASAPLAEAALCRAAMVRGEDYERIEAGDGRSDWRSFAAYASSGAWFTVTAPDAVPWNALPICAVQGEGDRIQYCRAGVCTPGLP